jgi:hypothetical protein
MNSFEAHSNPTKQAQPKRRILICVTGLSPQIVTETLFARTQSKVAPRGADWTAEEHNLKKFKLAIL